MKNYYYADKHPILEAIEAIGGVAIVILILFVIYSGLQFWYQESQKTNCQEIATFYQRSLPEGVEVKYVSGSCVRTDNLTVMTGNEKY
jgi:hypothetical protein